uniref:ATP-dependent Clp protease ATP-binding subunit ClpX n=1 Tax=Anthurium amnicola TaxID=1678845 RepID=A0A1D1YL01_9ARAE
MWGLVAQKGTRLLLRRLHLFSSSTVCRGAPPRPAELPGFMVEYLVSACELSRAEAVKVSSHLAHVRSTEKPDAVLRLMKQQGLGGAQIRRLLLFHPTILVADVEKTLEPKIGALLEAGFSGPELAHLISSSGISLPLRSVLHRIGFWRDLLGSNQNLLKALHKNCGLLKLRLEEKVIPTLSFLRSLGVSGENIGTILMGSPFLLTCSLKRVKAVTQQVESLGISPGSRMFVVALCKVSGNSQSTLDGKIKFLRSFGWSQAELISAFRAFPCIISISQKKIQTTMDFLLKEAGCSPSYVASRTVLFGLSLQRRLRPRFHVVQSLKIKGLHGGNHDLYHVMKLSEKKFVDKYIVPNSEKAPELLESYLAACANSISG